MRTNGLGSFYDANRLAQVASRVAQVDFDAIARDFRITKELAYDLASMALYDIVFFCDDSGSMKFEENGERVEDLKTILGQTAAIASKFDDNGLGVRFINSPVAANAIRTDREACDLVSKLTFSGGTRIGSEFKAKVLDGMVFSGMMTKPVLAVIITDGEPAGEDRHTLRKVIQDAKARLQSTYGRGALAVQIAQVGKDSGAQRFLHELDNDPVVGGMVDCTSYYELEAEECKKNGIDLTPELWLLKLCMGSISSEYDSKDM